MLAFAVAVALSAARDLPAAAARAAGAADSSLPTARPNDNRTAAGVTVGGARRIRLVVKRAVWHPDADDGPSLVTEAVGEEGKPLLIPAPLIRVPLGTRVDATVRNALPDTIVFVAQCAMPCPAKAYVYIAPGETLDVELTPKPGRYQLRVLAYSNVLVDVIVR